MYMYFVIHHDIFIFSYAAYSLCFVMFVHFVMVTETSNIFVVKYDIK